jgi:hypothetical protein
MTKADGILNKALEDIGVSINASPSEKFSHAYQVVEKLRIANEAETISVGTTGTITDRICEWALLSVGEDIFYRLTKRDVKWLGDYGLLGYPLNLIVSVKSFKAKERLLMSGTGSTLVPTIGFGLFDDPTEFSPARLVSYRMRGFLAIYMPKNCLDETPSASKAFHNWNASILLRPIEQFPSDLKKSLITIKEGSMERRFVNPVSF